MSRSANEKPNAPIAFFAYKRPLHTMKSLEALSQCEGADKSELIIFCDGPKGENDIEDVKKVRETVKRCKWCGSVTIVERDKNMGLASSIITGVTDLCNRFGRVIVIEDDLICSNYFLMFMNEALELYEDEEMVASIHAYKLPIKNKLPETYFIKGADCWGWATWERAWKVFEQDGAKLLNELKRRKLVREFNFNNSYSYTRMLEAQVKGKNDSWAVRWYASAFLKGMFTLHPGTSLVTNIGTDSSGIHCGESTVLDSDLANRPLLVDKLPIKENADVRKEIEIFYKSIRFNLIHQAIKGKIKRLIF